VSINAPLSPDPSPARGEGNCVGEWRSALTTPEQKPFSIANLQLGFAQAGIRKAERKDVLVMQLPDTASTAAVFTQNRFCAAPVQIAQQHIAMQQPRALIINTGCANAGTGTRGLEDAKHTCQAVAESMQLQLEQVLPFSTGVIGEHLPMARLLAGIPACQKSFSQHHWIEAAHTIMTTDTRAKWVSVEFDWCGQPAHITGISKGAGMICPNMATMLGFVATDLTIAPDLLQTLLNNANHVSFNRITIDGDTSTNDACVLIAAGSHASPTVTAQQLPLLQPYITQVLTQLAQAIVRDGEGATKFISIQVQGGNSEVDCDAVARTIAHSPLVKTALYAEDANWGRILAAIGRAPITELAIDQVSIDINQLPIVRHGQIAADYNETKVSAELKNTDIDLSIQLGQGNAQATVWTCDLSHDYVSINADYRS